MFGLVGMFIFPGTFGGSCEKIPCTSQVWIANNADEVCGNSGHNSHSHDSTAVLRVERAIVY